jgi:hypothetical protein
MTRNKPDPRENRRRAKLTLKEKRLAKKAKRLQANAPLARA